MTLEAIQGRHVSRAELYNALMSRSSLTQPLQSPAQILERLFPALENPSSLHALLESGLIVLAEELGSRPILYLEKSGKYLLYAAHGVKLSEEYAAMYPSKGQLERLKRGEVLVVTTSGTGGGVDGLSCDGDPCMLGVALCSRLQESDDSLAKLLGWVWIYQRSQPSNALKSVLAQFGSSWGNALEPMQAKIRSGTGLLPDFPQ